MLTAQMDTNWLSKEAARYLNLYVGELENWPTHIQRVWSRLKGTDEDKGERMRRTIACAILMPLVENHRIPDPPENLLYWCPSFHQYNDRDWYALMEETYKRDVQIAKWRNQCQSLGIIDPIDFAPITRQAFNWLMQSAVDSGDVTEANRGRIEQSFKRLVWAYGGAVICSIFQNHEPKIKRRVLNWRSNYFFERLIFEVYSVDQLVKIKRQELKKANPKLVKQIRKL